MPEEQSPGKKQEEWNPVHIWRDWSLSSGGTLFCCNGKKDDEVGLYSLVDLVARK